MSDFSKRLKSEIDYSGYLQKEIADKAGIKKRALDMYLGSRASMPPADVAVRLAKVLNVSVEYLVTGINSSNQFSTPKYKDIIDDLSELPDDILETFKISIHASAELQRKKKKNNPDKDLQA